MANVVNDAGQSAYLANLNKPITISVMNKLSSWQFQQQLSYNAMLPYIAKDFMGLQDLYDQFSIYSSTSLILQAAWKTIQTTVKLNLDVNKDLYQDPVLGTVGNLFLSIPSYSKVFTASSSDSLSDVQEAAE